MKKFLYAFLALTAMSVMASCAKDFQEGTAAGNGAPRQEIKFRPNGMSTRSAIDGTVFPKLYTFFASAAYEHTPGLSSDFENAGFSLGLDDDMIPANSWRGELFVNTDYYNYLVQDTGDDLADQDFGNEWTIHSYENAVRYYPVAGQLDITAVSLGNFCASPDNKLTGNLSELYADAFANPEDPDAVMPDPENGGAMPILTNMLSYPSDREIQAYVHPYWYYDNYDVMYGGAFNVTGSSAGTPMSFKHANAAICFFFKTNLESNSGDYVSIGGMQIIDGYFGGILSVTNNDDEISASWTFDDDRNYTFNYEDLPLNLMCWGPDAGVFANEWNEMFGNEPEENSHSSVFDGLADDTDESVLVHNEYRPYADFPFGEYYALVPPQPARKVCIEFTICQNGVETYSSKIIDLPGTWEMGKKYCYYIDIELNEITIDPVVVDWDAENVTPVVGSGRYSD